MQAWGHLLAANKVCERLSVIPALRRWRQEDQMFRARMGSTAGSTPTWATDSFHTNKTKQTLWAVSPTPTPGYSWSQAEPTGLVQLVPLAGFFLNKSAIPELGIKPHCLLCAVPQSPHLEHRGGGSARQYSPSYLCFVKHLVQCEQCVNVINGCDI